MSLKKISFGFFLLSLVQSGSAFGDSFIDLGLNWTQWLPKRGSVQKYQSEDRQAVITVPQPQRSWRTLSAEFGRNVPQNITPAANPVINETPQNVVVNQVMPVQPVVSAPEP
ncbi:MAG: hypothetical protein ACKO0V_02010, partial [bacterium]